jgi:hypothetical protein
MMTLTFPNTTLMPFPSRGGEKIVIQVKRIGLFEIVGVRILEPRNGCDRIATVCYSVTDLYCIFLCSQVSTGENLVSFE